MLKLLKPTWEDAAWWVTFLGALIAIEVAPVEGAGRGLVIGLAIGLSITCGRLLGRRDARGRTATANMVAEAIIQRVESLPMEAFPHTMRLELTINPDGSSSDPVKEDAA